MRTTLRQLTPLLRDATANVMPIAAAGMVVGMALVGSGVDMSRAYMVKSRLQAACDAGVLAGRRAVVLNGFDETATTQANAYFAANFNDGQQGTHNTSFAPVSSDDGKTVIGTARTKLDTAVMRVFSFDNFDLRVNCTSTMGVGNSDIVMVLDTTGSMASSVDLDKTDSSTKTISKINALKNAMKSFYATVEKATEDSNARIRYGFVPYSSAVNVGKLIYAENPDFLVDSTKIQTRIPKYNGAPQDGPWSDPDFSTSSSVLASTDNTLIRYSSTSYASAACTTQKNALNVAAPWTNVGDGDPAGEPTTTTSAMGSRRITTTLTSSKRFTQPVYVCTKVTEKQGNKNVTVYYIEYKTNIQIRNDYAVETRYLTEPETPPGAFHHWVYFNATRDVSQYKTGQTTSIVMGNNGETLNYKWAGCIEERKTVAQGTFSFSPADGVLPSDALDLNLDLIPTSNDDTKWVPIWPEVSLKRGYYESTVKDGKTVVSFRQVSNDEYNDGQVAGFYCPTEARLLAPIATQKAFDDYANSLKPDGSTYHDIGMIWGGRLSSPDGIFGDNVKEEPNNGGSVSRHLIFMTDGMMDTSNNITTTYGIEVYDKRVTTNGSTGQDARHTSRFLAVCEAVKAKQIRVWVIAFGEGTSLTTDLQKCASDSSAFEAKDAGSLNAAFQEIAKQVGELRVMQ